MKKRYVYMLVYAVSVGIPVGFILYGILWFVAFIEAIFTNFEGGFFSTYGFFLIFIPSIILTYMCGKYGYEKGRKKEAYGVNIEAHKVYRSLVIFLLLSLIVFYWHIKFNLQWI